MNIGLHMNRLMTYGGETCSLTTAQIDAPVVAQRKMERIILGITLRARNYNSWMGQQSRVTAIINPIKNSKHQGAGHVARVQSKRSKQKDWLPSEWIRPRGKPTVRRRNDFVHPFGSACSRLVRDRCNWKHLLNRERMIITWFEFSSFQLM